MALLWRSESEPLSSAWRPHEFRSVRDASSLWTPAPPSTLFAYGTVGNFPRDPRRHQWRCPRGALKRIKRNCLQKLVLLGISDRALADIRILECQAEDIPEDVITIHDHGANYDENNGIQELSAEMHKMWLPTKI
ncbi:hypothetical protein KM043_015455 [Ampulex compressa]|nr:hypothetical protein KM043_015455 [Ampulex compressa]